MRFVNAMDDFDNFEKKSFAQFGDFLGALEKTPMVKSYKMVVLLAMLNDDAFPGEIGIYQLVRGVRKLVSRSAILQADFGSSWENPEDLQKLLERNPINAWISGRGTGGVQYFRYESETFQSTFEVPNNLREVTQNLTREIVDWRLAEYLQ